MTPQTVDGWVLTYRPADAGLPTLRSVNAVAGGCWLVAGDAGIVGWRGVCPRAVVDAAFRMLDEAALDAESDCYTDEAGVVRAKRDIAKGETYTMALGQFLSRPEGE